MTACSVGKRISMKRKIASILVTGLCAMTLFGCSKKEDNGSVGSSAVTIDQKKEASDTASSQSTTAENTANSKEVPAGMYLSEITGEPIDESLKNQRPIAVMVDNEATALPHYGTAQADVVYELMNSTANNRITRLMCVVKDWGKIKQLGSIRSTRPTNIVLAAEWNAVLCHDGGPFYNNTYFGYPWGKEHFSGIFSRVNNGKSREFTEYIVTGDLDDAFANSGYSKEYNSNRVEDETHFNFSDYGTEVDLSKAGGEVKDVNEVVLPFKHNGSMLKYNDSTKKYEYYEYGKQHLDADSKEPLAFTNVILQSCSFAQLDQNGYLVYNYLSANKNGYYLTNGKCIPITWTKLAETDITRYYDMNGKELTINSGKTYISLIPEDTWKSVDLK